MSKEKQIEEMAKVMCGYYGTEKCYECRYCCDCHIKQEATRLYNAGYRKQSNDVPDTNVGCKFCENDSLLDDLVCYIPTDDGASIDPPVRYCPFCGRRILEEEQT